jgi:hypothetical protein
MVEFSAILFLLLITYLGTGKMPVPQENLSFVERASCPFFTMVQYLRSIALPAIFQPQSNQKRSRV